MGQVTAMWSFEESKGCMLVNEGGRLVQVIESPAKDLASFREWSKEAEKGVLA